MESGKNRKEVVSASGDGTAEWGGNFQSVFDEGEVIDEARKIPGG